MEDEIKRLKDLIEFYKLNYVTGLPGRHDFMGDITTKFNEGKRFFLEMHDVNGLHEVNRLQGYSAGDALLRRVANSLKLCDNQCLVYHIGGDEFFVLYNKPPAKPLCKNTTSALVVSTNYDSVEDMLDQVDKMVSEQKRTKKMRRRDDI